METLVNFRDIGGYTGADGKKVIDGKLFRSGEIVDLSANDQVAFTDKYGIAQIYDFRGDQEVGERPDEKFPGVCYHHIDIMRDVHGKTASMDDMMENSSHAHQAMMMIYEELVMSQGAQNGYREFLEGIVSHPKEGSIFHCFAGKDRTGVGAALILATLGVSEDDIYYDYLKTNVQRKAANDQILAGLKANGKTPEEISMVSTMLYVEEDYLRHAQKIMMENFGGLKEYLKSALDLGQDFVAELRGCYLI